MSDLCSVYMQEGKECHPCAETTAPAQDTGLPKPRCPLGRLVPCCMTETINLKPNPLTCGKELEPEEGGYAQLPLHCLIMNFVLPKDRT